MQRDVLEIFNNLCPGAEIVLRRHKKIKQAYLEIWDLRPQQTIYYIVDRDKFEFRMQ